MNQEKIEEKIQKLIGNPYSVLLREAFVQLAPMMITMGAGLFIYSLAIKWLPIQISEWTHYSVWIYSFLGLWLSSLIIVKIAGRMQADEKSGKEVGALSVLNFFLFIAKGWMTNPDTSFIEVASTSIVPAVVFGFLFGWSYRQLLRLQMDNPFPQFIPQAVINVWNETWRHAVMFGIIIVLAWNTPIYHWMVKGTNHILSILNTPITMIIVISLICTFWLKGIHGVAAVGLFLRPFWFQMLVMNGAAFLMSQPAVYIFHESFFQWFVWIGGSGATLGLAICLKCFAKSNRFKSLAESGTISTWFNINETVLFGLPVAGNKYMIVPFILSPLLNGLIGYLFILNGYVDNLFLTVPWVFPVPLGLFAATGGDVKAFLVSFLLIGLSAAIYYPFFRKLDQMELKKEQESQF